MTDELRRATAWHADACRDHVRRYLEAPHLADRRRLEMAERFAGSGGDYLYGEELWPDVDTPGLPPSLRLALEDWVTAESTLDEEVAAFIGWPLGKVRDHR